MDASISTAVVSALAFLATKSAETMVSEGVKDAYTWTKGKLGIADATHPLDQADEAQKALEAQPELGREIAERLSQNEDEAVRQYGDRLLAKLGPPAPLVGTIKDSSGVNVATHIETVNQTFHGHS